MIEVRSIVKKFGARTVLDDVSLTVPSGEIAALVGPSGGGKSTMLRCIHGFETFESGTVEVAGVTMRAGRSAQNDAARKRIRQKAGFVFQQWHLFAHLTALENVIEAPVHVQGVALKAATEHARALLEKVGLSHREGALPRRLSGGEQQRVAIARALAMRPQVLLMDEPTSALDPERIGDLVELLVKLAHDEKLTLVAVTHDMAFAQKLAQKAYVLAGGKLIEEGTPDEVLASPKHPRTREFLGLDR